MASIGKGVSFLTTTARAPNCAASSGSLTTDCGIGGLLFDYCRPNEVHDLASWYAFITQMGDAFLDAYLPIVQKRKILPYTDAQRQWQEIRRGRYVEFNLVHDKGTLFGLKTKGRIESILMSLPPTVQWAYDVQPEENSEEAKLITVLKNPITWV